LGYPDEVVQVAAMLFAATGKIDRNRLRELCAEMKFAAGANGC